MVDGLYDTARPFLWLCQSVNYGKRLYRIYMRTWRYILLNVIKKSINLKISMFITSLRLPVTIFHTKTCSFIVKISKMLILWIVTLNGRQILATIVVIIPIFDFFMFQEGRRTTKKSVIRVWWCLFFKDS